MNDLYQKDFLLTWEKSDNALKTILELALLIKNLRNQNISPKVFDTGLAMSVFRDKSTRTR